MLAGVVACLLRPHSSTVFAWVLLWIILVLVDVLLAPSARTLRITREATSAVRTGEPTQTSLLVTNEGNRRVNGALRDAWQPSASATDNRHRLRLPAGERVRLTTPLLPTRRGDLVCDRVTVRTTGPLGLAMRQSGFDAPGVLRSLPAFPSRKQLPSRMAKLQQIEGRAVVRNRGQGTEFDSLRDYVEGDDVRSIDWRATARRQAIVVRTWRPERDRRILIVLDTSRVSAARVGDITRLDAAMDAVQFLAALATRAGDHVSFIAGDHVVRSTITSTGRQDALPRIAEAMCRLEPALVEADWIDLGAEVAKMGRRQSLVVLLTPLERAAIEESLLPSLSVLAAQHRIVIASVSDPELVGLTSQREDVHDVYVAAAAERTLLERQRLTAALKAVGVDVVDEPADEIAVKLADHYLMLKSRGLL